jgi:uncharacterized protein (UPF0335 family)
MEIKKATLWLFDKINSNNNNRHKRLRRRKTAIKVDMERPNEAAFTNDNSSDDGHIVFQLDDLYNIIEFDLDNSYTKIGNRIFKQTKGCPIGGLLSSFLANSTCAHHEWTFMQNEPQLTKHIRGIRQMDDLMIWIAHNRSDKNGGRNTRMIKDIILNKLYKGGLEAEEEDPVTNNDTKCIHNFAGHEIHTHKNLDDIFTTTLNPNKESIWNQGIQHKKRFPHKESYTNTHVKTGNIIGSIHRLREQNTYRNHFSNCIIDLAKELKCIGYSTQIIKKCLYRLNKQDDWKIMMRSSIARILQKKILKNLPTNRPDPTEATRTTPSKVEIDRSRKRIIRFNL